MMMLHRKMEPIPPFESGASIFRRLSGLVRPKAHLSVSEWAERHMPDYDPLALPFLSEIMDALSDPETNEVGDMGPAQAGKSLVGLAWMGWSIEHDPADFLVCQPDKALMQDFVIRRVNPMIEKTPCLRPQLLPVANADNIFLKQFRGMLLTSIWPVGSQFRARPVPRGWLDDYDQLPDDIDGQGNAIKLLDGRQTTFEGRDTKLVSSSPANDDGGGIEAFVAGGTDERLMPICPSCSERIELDIQRDLKFDRGSLDEAEASAHVICPASGCVLEPEARRQLIDSTANLPNRGWVSGNASAGKRRRGFRRDGLLSFTSWGKLAREWRDAELAWETRQDESALRTFFNVKGGKNYRSVLNGEKPLVADDLARLKDGFKLGTMPQGPVVWDISVDVQFDRFECSAIGYADGMESWFIDRWSIDVLEDGLTQLDPFRKPEHWRVLLPLFDKTYPLAGTGGHRSPKPLTVAIDTGGGGDKEANATDGAYKFWHLAVAAGVHSSRITLVKGGSKITADPISRARRADQKSKGGVKRNSPTLWIVNVHKGKHILDARLRRIDPGPGRVHLPADWRDEWSAELTAEQLEAGKWTKIRARNETLDLALYAWFALLKPPFAQSRSTMRWVPSQFRIRWPDGPVIAAESPASEIETEAVPKALAAMPARKPRVMKPRQRTSWLGRLK